jgi:hypothetical protein
MLCFLFAFIQRLCNEGSPTGITNTSTTPFNPTTGGPETTTITTE